jgi:prepilin-type N-terminal cleavage/methylation domain-containing protein
MRLPRPTQDGGFTLVELAIVSAILAIAVAIVSAALYSGLRTTGVAQQEASSLNDARVAQAQILKDVRSAVAVDSVGNTSCTSAGAPVGYCLLLYYQSPSVGTVDQIRYRAVQVGGSTGATTLYRDSACDPVFNCTTNRALVTNLGNRAQSVAMFSCNTASSYPQISLSLIVAPLSPSNGGTLTLNTSVRPRNIGGTQC